MALQALCGVAFYDKALLLIKGFAENCICFLGSITSAVLRPEMNHIDFRNPLTLSLHFCNGSQGRDLSETVFNNVNCDGPTLVLHSLTYPSWPPMSVRFRKYSSMPYNSVSDKPCLVLFFIPV